MQNPFSKTFLDVKFLCERIFKIFAAHIRTKGILNNDKIIFVIREKKLLLKDVANGLAFPMIRTFGVFIKCSASYGFLVRFG